MVKDIYLGIHHIRTVPPAKRNTVRDDDPKYQATSMRGTRRFETEYKRSWRRILWEVFFPTAKTRFQNFPVARDTAHGVPAS